MSEVRSSSWLRALVGLSARGGETKAPLATVVLTAVAVGMAVLHMAQLYAFFLPSGQFKNLHLGLAILIAFLAALEGTPQEQRVRRAMWAGLALLALVPLVYIHVEYEAFVRVRKFLPNTADTLVALLLMALAFVATAREWGWVIPALAVVGLLYGSFGYLLPGELLQHGGIVFPRLIGYSSIPYFQGLLGGLTELSAGVIFLFMLFAGVLKVTGGIDFIISLAYAIGGRSRAGPAQVAVVASGFMGMLSGSTVANVASTGSLTIPMMKRFGFRPEFAGAVEAVASTGGQLTPPVMGLAAFLIVGITGIPYLEVMAAAVFPALIYYLYLMVAVHVRAAKVGLDARAQQGDAGGAMREVEVASVRDAFLRYGHLLLGIGVLIYFLVIRMPPGTAALYGALALLALDVLRRLLTSWRDPAAGLRDAVRVVIRSLDEGARSGAAVATVIAVIGILVEVLTVTGFAQKLSNAMLDLSGGSLPLLLVIAAVTCLAFGLGLPTSAAYILVALLGAPALRDLGVPLLAAHLFVFYFANLSAITPPVAISALVGANLAGARFLPTALLSVRLGLPGFLLPFLFVARPAILGLETSLAAQLVVVILALVAVLALNLALEGFFLTTLTLWERVLLLPAAFGLLWPGWASTAAGMALLLAIIARQVLASRRTSAVATAGRPPPASELGKSP